MRGAEMSKVQGEAINVQAVFINAQSLANTIEYDCWQTAQTTGITHSIWLYISTPKSIIAFQSYNCPIIQNDDRVPIYIYLIYLPIL